MEVDRGDLGEPAGAVVESPADLRAGVADCDGRREGLVIPQREKAVDLLLLRNDSYPAVALEQVEEPTDQAIGLGVAADGVAKIVVDVEVFRRRYR